MGQLLTQLVCQTCGRVTVTGSKDAKGWLNEPHRRLYYINVVRCPQDISEWSLRNTKRGRTKEARKQMREGKEMPVPPIPAWLSPFPTTNKEAK